VVSSYWERLWFPLVLQFVQVFDILFALPAIDTDFVHEPGTTGDLIIPCSVNLKRTADVSWVEEGKDPLGNKGLSSQAPKLYPLHIT